MPIRAILFDKDGTLVDFQRTWGPATHTVLTRALQWRPRGLRAPRAPSACMTPRSARLLPGSPVVIETTYGYGKLWARGARRAADAANLSTQIDRLFFQTTLDHLTPMGDVKALLSGLAARGLRLGLMTNDADANTRAQLRQPRARRAAGIRRGLRFRLRPQARSRTRCWPLRSSPGVAPAEIAVVGDTEHDLVAARAAGAIAVGVLSGPIPRERLEPHADVLLPSIAQLDEWLCSIRRRANLWA